MMAAESLDERPTRDDIRTFYSVRGALLWYRDVLASKLRCTQVLGESSVRRSRVAIDQGNATFAAIAQCLRTPHPSDPKDEEALASIRYLTSGERVVWLVASYEPGHNGDTAWLADQAKLTRWSFNRLCKRTERALRKRMDFAGLIRRSD